MAPAEDRVAREFDRFRGKLAGFIEAIGLPDRQERAIVSTMKQLSYDAQAEVARAVLQSSPSA